MPAARRVRTPPTDDWEVLQLRLHWPEQVEYELIRPVVVFGLTPAERAEQTGAAVRTIGRQADVFDRAGFAGLLGTDAPAQRVPEGIRDALLLLKGEYPAFNPHELTSIAAVRFGRRLSYHTVKRLLDTGPVPTAPPRRFLPYHQLQNGTERRLAIVRLHLEGWSVQSIAVYLATSRQTVYTALQRWVSEDFAGLPDKSRARKRRALKVDLRTLETARQLQENPELGAFRLHSRLKEEFGIDLSRSTCGRILQHNRALYGLPGPQKQPTTPKAMPFAARYPHQYWTVDLRYIDVR